MNDLTMPANSRHLRNYHHLPFITLMIHKQNGRQKSYMKLSKVKIYCGNDRLVKSVELKLHINQCLCDQESILLTVVKLTSYL